MQLCKHEAHVPDVGSKESKGLMQRIDHEATGSNLNAIRLLVLGPCAIIYLLFLYLNGLCKEFMGVDVYVFSTFLSIYKGLGYIQVLLLLLLSFLDRLRSSHGQVVTAGALKQGP